MERKYGLWLKIGASLLALTLILAACASDDDEEPTPAPDPTPTEETTPEPTPTEVEDVPTPEPAATETPVDDADDAVGDADDATGESGELVAAGAELFENSCQVCHGERASGAFAPNIQGQGASAIRSALRAVPDMSGLNLSPGEIEALGEYLRSLD